MINVLHLRDTDRICGPGKTVLETSSRIDQSKFNLSVGVMMLEKEESNYYYDALLQRGVTAYPIRAKHQFDFNVIQRIIDVVKKNNIHIIHSHDYKTDILAFIVSKKYKIPIVTTIHGWITNSFKSKLYVWLGKRVLPFFNQVIAVSPKIDNELARVGVKQKCRRLIYNAIVMESYNPDDYESGYLRQQFNLPDDAKLIGYLGRVSPEKGQVDFIEAGRLVCEKHANVYFFVIGDGPDKQKLQSYVENIGLKERIIFTGYLHDVKAIYKDLDITALTSYTEGFPNVVLESLTMDIPVLATNVGGVKDIIEDKKTGILVEAGDQAAITAGLLHLIEQPDKARIYTEQGKKAVTEKFEFTIRVNKVQKLYQDVISDWKKTNPSS